MFYVDDVCMNKSVSLISIFDYMFYKENLYIIRFI